VRKQEQRAYEIRLDDQREKGNGRFERRLCLNDREGIDLKEGGAASLTEERLKNRPRQTGLSKHSRGGALFKAREKNFENAIHRGTKSAGSIGG